MTYAEVVEAISGFYNTSAESVWNVINDYNLTPEQAFDLVPNPSNYFNSGYGTVNYANGATASWNNYVQLPVSSGTNPFDSNAGIATQTQFQLPTSSDYGGGGGGIFNGGQNLGGVPQGKVPIMTQVSTGIAAAGLGIQLGKIIDKAAYDNGFNWLSWAGVDMESLNPETWDSITVDMSDTGFQGLVKRAFNAIFAVDENGSQMYIDENAAGYLAMYMDKTGMFTPSTPTITPSDDLRPATKTWLETYFPNGLQLATPPTSYKLRDTEHIIQPVGADIDTLLFRSADARYLERVSFFSENTFTINDNGTISNPTSSNYNDINGQNHVYYYKSANWYSDQGEFINASPINVVATTGSWYAPGNIAEVLKFGTKTQPSTITGIDNQNGATLPNFATATTPADYLNLLRLQYPDLFNNAITQTVAQPDGTTVTHTYIPVGTPTATSTSDNQPTTNPDISGQSQTTPTVDPTTATDPLIEGLISIITNLTNPTTPPPSNPVDTGTGDSPEVIPPTGGASSLWAVYNPTQAQVNDFGAWLWSSNFVEQIKKLFSDPMQGIIGLHKIFATPATGAAQNIKVGYLDSGVPSAIVTNQYTDIDCGTVNVAEYFGNVFDYEDTTIRLYLPFIGIVDLSTSDVMRGSVRVVYHVDVITGACLADVIISRDGAGGVLYQYSGDAAVRYPVSSGSYMGMVNGVLAVVGGVVGVASGGAALPAVMGAVGGIMNSRTSVKHSGSFSGAAGAMGAKIPYLIIERPQSAVANDFVDYQGIGDNRVVSVSALTGYFKMTDVHTNSIVGATAEEIEQITALLEGGVIQ